MIMNYLRIRDIRKARNFFNALKNALTRFAHGLYSIIGILVPILIIAVTIGFFIILPAYDRIIVKKMSVGELINDNPMKGYIIISIAVTVVSVIIAIICIIVKMYKKKEERK